MITARVHFLRHEYSRIIEHARALAAETLKLERTLSDLVNQAYGLTPAQQWFLHHTPPFSPLRGEGRFTSEPSIVVVRIMDGAKPHPPQTFKPADLLTWVRAELPL